jgi:hypothetical protein
LKRTADFFGFHAALAVGAAIALVRKPDWRMAAWIALALAGAILGLRFFPRYYFLLLPPLIVLAARGWSQAGRAWILLIALLAIPAVRFAPSYFTLARSRDLTIDRDSRAVARQLRQRARPGDTLFVWGFRPDIFIDSEMPAGTRFLESQPISGVLADRHLFSSEAIAPDFTAPHRLELEHSRPTWVVDGLGILNPPLALQAQPYLAGWFAQYREVGRTAFSILYRLR